MSKTKVLVLTVSVCLMTGCNSKQVQMYAGRLDLLLADYRAGVQGRMDAERKMYDQISGVFATEAEREVYESLKLERLRQQRIVTGDLGAGRIQPSQIGEKLRETVLGEFDRTRTWFDQELNAQQQYEAGLAMVALDAKKLEALDGALKAVEKNLTLKTALNDVTTLGTTFQKEYRLQQCKNFEREVGITKESIAEWQARKPEGSDEESTAADGEAIKKRTAELTASQKDVQEKLDANPNFKVATGETQKKCQ